MRRLSLLGALACCLALAGEPARITFIHPRAAIVMAGFYGTDVPVQTRMTPLEQARVWSLVWDGENCGGSSMRTLDGASSAAIQPEERPLMVRMGPPSCVLVASVLSGSGAILERAEFHMTVR